MPRAARIVVPGVAHHVTQRGNRRQPVFFHDGDYALYKALMAEWCDREGVEVWAYCLMTNHVHLIAVVLRRCDKKYKLSRFYCGLHALRDAFRRNAPQGERSRMRAAIAELTEHTMIRSP